MIIVKTITTCLCKMRSLFAFFLRFLILYVDFQQDFYDDVSCVFILQCQNISIFAKIEILKGKRFHKNQIDDQRSNNYFTEETELEIVIVLNHFHPVFPLYTLSRRRRQRYSRLNQRENLLLQPLVKLQYELSLTGSLPGVLPSLEKKRPETSGLLLFEKENLLLNLFFGYLKAEVKVC